MWARFYLLSSEYGQRTRQRAVSLGRSRRFCFVLAGGECVGRGGKVAPFSPQSTWHNTRVCV